jgi:hypothetical protein
MEKICKNCKHYKAVKGEKYGDCGKMYYGYFHEGGIATPFTKAKQGTQNFSHVCFSDNFYVGENFGCIHYKEKQ